MRRGGGQRDVELARPARLRRHRVAEQRADRHVMGAAERPEREGKRRHQPVEQRERRARPDSSAGSIGSGMIEPNVHAISERQHRAQRQADGAADGGQQQNLREIDREHARCRKRRAPSWWRWSSRSAVEMAFDRIADADAADQQRGQADDGEELREALDVALELRRGIAAAADVPAGFGKCAARLRRHRLAPRRRSASLAGRRRR